MSRFEPRFFPGTKVSEWASVSQTGNTISSAPAPPPMTYSSTGSPTERTHGVYKSLHWTGSGTFTITANPTAIDVFVVSGGGGGGGGYASGTG